MQGSGLYLLPEKGQYSQKIGGNLREAYRKKWERTFIDAKIKLL
jgi:hypothetical protein